jgi:hypothetical protein
VLLPAGKLEVVNVAWPVESSVTVASVALGSLKVTVPVAVPVPGAFGVAVAVNVTAPDEGLGADVSVP